MDEIACRGCGATIVIDSGKMLHRGDHAVQACGACGAEARLRLSDLNRPPLSRGDNTVSSVDHSDGEGGRRPKWLSRRRSKPSEESH